MSTEPTTEAGTNGRWSRGHAAAMTLLSRLRDLFAHARAGHRIGCETCAHADALRNAGFGWMEDWVWDPEPRPADPPARSPVDAARERGDL